MDGDLFDFQWSVPASGFRWVEGSLVKRGRSGRANRPARTRPPSGVYLVANSSEGDTNESRSYNPFDVEPPLFRTFADTEPDEAGILKFANQFGSLTQGEKIQASGQTEEIPGQTPLRGVSLFSWSRQIIAMRAMVRLADLCEHENESGLSRYIRWKLDQSEVNYHYDDASDWHFDSRETIAFDPRQENGAEGVDRGATWFSRLTPGDVLLPALVLLQRVINHHLRTKAHPQLLWDRRSGRLSLGSRPPNLIKLLWMQLANGVSFESSYRPCLSCGRWIRVGPDAGRASRLYCSNACRMRGLRVRQQEARVLRSKGESIETIADELNSDVPTITRWVAEDQETD